MDSPAYTNKDQYPSDPVWIVARSENLVSRLTQLPNGNVQFVPDDHSIYNAQTQIEKLWRFQGDHEGYKIVNSSTKNCLHPQKEQGHFSKLSCSQFNKNFEKVYFWKFQPSSTYRSFVIKSIEKDEKGYPCYISKDKDNHQIRILANLHQEQAENVLKSTDHYDHYNPYSPYNQNDHYNHDQYSPKLKPKFKGLVVDQSHSLYHFSRQQYASSSYQFENMSPHIICYPIDIEDVKTAIRYAQSINKKAIGRSGGHQYSGKSSGGSDTIVISMNCPNFRVLQKRSDNQNLVDVGPGVTNKVINNQLTKWGFSVPHGECPYVCIGGHAQTGGYGHFSRSFGLNGDYVEAFQIVLANGEVHEVTRPNSIYLERSSAITQELNNKIFTSVLTGNAGSFGIITRYTYKFIRDTDHPNSYGYSKIRSYNKGVFKQLLQHCRDWTILIEKKEDEQKLKGLNMAISLASTKFPSWIEEKYRFPIMMIQLLYADLDKVPYDDQFKTIIETSEKQLTTTDKILNAFMGGHSKKVPLSSAAHAFVRKWPFVTVDGRQYALPYKKRVNVTLSALTQQFVQRISDLVDKIFDQNKVKLIFQIGIGGGALRSKGEEINKQGFITYPHRNSTFCFSFDLFYNPDLDEEKRAIELHNDIGKIVEECYNSGGQQRRRFWGSFGNTDMSNPDIVNMYYDNHAQYETLQKVKAELDPMDTFHTNFTVQLPKNP